MTCHDVPLCSLPPHLSTRFYSCHVICNFSISVKTFRSYARVYSQKARARRPLKVLIVCAHDVWAISPHVCAQYSALRKFIFEHTQMEVSFTFCVNLIYCVVEYFLSLSRRVRGKYNVHTQKNVYEWKVNSLRKNIQ